MKKHLKEILTYPENEFERADEFNILDKSVKHKKVMYELKTTLKENKDVPALAAPQVGSNIRMFAINFNGDIKVFINPIIEKTTGMTFSRETNPSEPGKEFIVPRHEEIIATYTKANGGIESNRFIGIASYIFQQQINVLDGIMLSDYGLEIDEDFDNATDEERQEVLDMYMKNLKESQIQLEEEIKSDKDLNQVSEAIRFLNSVNNGEVTTQAIEDAKEEIEQRLKFLQEGRLNAKK